MGAPATETMESYATEPKTEVKAEATATTTETVAAKTEAAEQAE